MVLTVLTGLIKICKTLKNKSIDDLLKELTEGRQYLKGNHHDHCSINGCKGIADHCIKYALSDEKESYKSACGGKHDKACFECDSLSQILMGVKNLITNTQNITENERNNFHLMLLNQYIVFLNGKRIFSPQLTGHRKTTHARTIG